MHMPRHNSEFRMSPLDEGQVSQMRPRRTGERIAPSRRLNYPAELVWVIIGALVMMEKKRAFLLLLAGAAETSQQAVADARFQLVRRAGSHGRPKRNPCPYLIPIRAAISAVETSSMPSRINSHPKSRASE